MLRALIFLSLAVISSSAFPAEVKKVTEKSGAILIDEGEDTGFSKGKKVCFLDSSAKQVLCGKVAKSMKNKALVAVSKDKASSLKEGFKAVLADGKSDKSDADPKAKKKTEKSLSYNYSITPSVHFIFLTPATFNKLEYVAPSAANPTQSNWQPTIVSSIIIPPGFGLEFEAVKIHLTLGARYGFYPGTTIISNADETSAKANLAANTISKGDDLGVYADFTYFTKGGFSFKAGLDFDMSKITIEATETDDNDSSVSTNIVTADSSLSTISLRLPIVYKKDFGSIGLSGNLGILVPLFASGPTTNVTLGDGTNTDQAAIDLAQADFIASLGHKKAAIALDLAIGLSINF